MALASRSYERHGTLCAWQGTSAAALTTQRRLSKLFLVLQDNAPMALTFQANLFGNLRRLPAHCGHLTRCLPVWGGPKAIVVVVGIIRLPVFHACFRKPGVSVIRTSRVTIVVVAVQESLFLKPLSWSVASKDSLCLLGCLAHLRATEKWFILRLEQPPPHVLEQLQDIVLEVRWVNAKCLFQPKQIGHLT
ncbi:hypothetical protein K470DRAFT_159788 [Piedraia hortae CBS 480.64]|uniref:Uncharacterized protein n=1 Tax=Piedraia hortae CBS 480.64 TaxID=1314780 RepID=A0A6A7BSM9_9PEZI|nr:hypothetical protein K470DRAFT_159788 [Piedraia hortae CBS 480.64]